MLRTHPGEVRWVSPCFSLSLFDQDNQVFQVDPTNASVLCAVGVRRNPIEMPGGIGSLAWSQSGLVIWLYVVSPECHILQLCFRQVTSV